MLRIVNHLILKAKTKKTKKKEGKTPQRLGSDRDANQPLVKILHVKVKFFSQIS